MRRLDIADLARDQELFWTHATLGPRAAAASGGGRSGRRRKRSHPDDDDDNFDDFDPTDHDPQRIDATAHFRYVAAALARAHRCIACTGAGISVSAGIPDFRSEDGLYNVRRPPGAAGGATMRGKDLFDSAVFRDPSSTSQFFEFMAALKEAVDGAESTPTHRFLNDMAASGRLMRHYTQNIDGLESRVRSSLEPSPPPSSTEEPQTNSTTSTTLRSDILIHLHGDLANVICTLCTTKFPFSPNHHETFKRGTAPPCPSCQHSHAVRSAQGKRALVSSVGTLRPNVVLYGEDSGNRGAHIAECVRFDSKRRPDCLMVIGTSLRVDGVRHLVRELAGAVHRVGGIVVLVNTVTLSKEWERVFDYHLVGECDVVFGAITDEWTRAKKAARYPHGRSTKKKRKTLKKKRSPAMSGQGVLNGAVTKPGLSPGHISKCVIEAPRLQQPLEHFGSVKVEEKEEEKDDLHAVIMDAQPFRPRGRIHI